MWLVGGALAATVSATSAAAPGAFSAQGRSTSIQSRSASALPQACQPNGSTQAQKTKIATAKLIIEFNATDNDLGVHGAFDDDGWSEHCVLDPSGRPIAAVDPLNQLNDLTMAGIFFESREPPGAEFSMADLAAAFPEGRYRVRGASFDGTVLTGNALFTHDVPAAPTITSPELAADPEQPGTPVPRNNLVIGWDTVTETVTGGPIKITGYEVIITKEVEEDPHGSPDPPTTCTCRPL
jgi:hypothetical protein